MGDTKFTGEYIFKGKKEISKEDLDLVDYANKKYETTSIKQDELANFVREKLKKYSGD